MFTAAPVTYGRIQGQGSNPSHTCNLCHSCGNAGSLTHCYTEGTPNECFSSGCHSKLSILWSNCVFRSLPTGISQIPCLYFLGFQVSGSPTPSSQSGFTDPLSLQPVPLSSFPVFPSALKSSATPSISIKMPLVPFRSISIRP